ncbi:MAG: response regulator [Chlamydiales bacterium]|nr:response regulator [Chlamydiales bacterium]
MSSAKKRILLADPSKELMRQILHAPDSKTYLFETALNGTECLKKIDTFQPDLILLDLLLPQMHGIEILRKLKADESRKNVGVILSSAQAMIQNYHTALNAGADYFLEKPFEIEHLFEIFQHYFAGTLTPPPFLGQESGDGEAAINYHPRHHSNNSYIKFWGTRGSNPVSGKEYIRYGGNTSCLEVRHGKDLVIIDAGTGIRPLGSTPFIQDANMIHLVVGHTHWDHIIGFPFFTPLYRPDCHVTIWSPVGFEKPTKELFTEMLAYAYFPVRLDDIRARISFKDITEGVPFSIGDIEIDTHYTYHPGATVCFKISTPGNKTIAYVTDNEMLMGYQGDPNEIDSEHPLLEPHKSMLKFLKGCDLLIHEAQYFPAEYQKKIGWGHSSITNATALVKHTGIKEWVVTHHDPSHSDEDLQRKLQCHHDILDDCKITCRVRFAFDGLKLPL